MFSQPFSPMSEERSKKLEQLIEEAGHVSKALEEARSKSCELLSIVAPQFLVHRVAKLLLRHPHCCVLWQYSGDNTPIRSRTWETLRAGSGARRASAKITEEYYSQALICSIWTGEGEPCHASILTPPTILAHGKTMKALFGIAAAMPGISLIGQGTAIEVFHQIHDRAMVSSFRAAMAGRISERKGQTVELQTSAGERRVVQSLHLWSTSVGCAAHDLHNSLKWSSHAVYGESATKEHLKSFYTCFQCLKVGLSCCLKFLGPWLDTVVVVTTEMPGPPSHVKQEFYEILGVPSEDATEAAGKGFWWHHNGILYVAESFWFSENSMAYLTGFILDNWKAGTYSESRWLSLGACSRQLLLCVCTGYVAFYGWLRTSKCISEWDSSGFGSWSEELLQWTAFVALCSMPCDCLLAEVLENACLAGRHEVLQGIFGAAHARLDGVSSNFWSTLASYLGKSAALVEHEVLGGSMVAWSYIDAKFMRTLRDYPWCLLNGDLTENLRALLAGDTVPDDPICFKIVALAKQGTPERILLEGIRLLTGCSFCSALVERLHASAALVRKFHPEISGASLVSRSFMHTLRSCCPFKRMFTPHLSVPSFLRFLT
eukprot:821360-Amphidinium_carterae.1